jgi:hypothetical protein
MVAGITHKRQGTVSVITIDWATVAKQDSKESKSGKSDVFGSVNLKAELSDHPGLCLSGCVYKIRQ